MLKVLSQKDVSIKLETGANKIECPTSQILIPEAEIDCVIKGAYLEACIQFDHCYLVFTSDDCPHEESLNVYLLGQDNQVLDYSSIFWPYGTGSFELIQAVEPNLVYFKFFAGKSWCVELFEKKRFVLPFVRLAIGSWRRFGVMRHFVVYENK